MDTQPDFVKNLSIGTRTYCVRTSRYQGTAFTMDVEGRRYLITARHVMKGVFGPNRSGNVSIETKMGQKAIDVKLVGNPDPELDICVLKPSSRLHRSDFRTVPPPVDTPPAQVGEDVYSFGFPLGLSTTKLKFSTSRYPKPLLRKCMVSGFGTDHYFLDGLANPGTSGGPVFRMGGTIPVVIGVVVRRCIETAKVTEGKLPTELTVDYNSGIVVVTPFKHVMDIIRSNPIGLEVGEPANEPVFNPWSDDHRDLP